MPSENSVQNCSCALAARHLFAVGRGTDRKKINLRQGWEWKKEEGQRRTERKSSVWPRQGPWVPPAVFCLHTEKFRTISQLSFQWPLKRDRFLPGYSPSIHWEWLLSWENPNLWHPQWVTALRGAIASVQTAVLRKCLWNLCVREVQGALLGLNQTGPLIQGVQSASRVCLHSCGSFSEVQ